MNGKTWEVESIYAKKDNTHTHTFSAGFKKFVQDNGIRRGDICIFELIGEFKVEVLVLKVRDPSDTFIQKVILHMNVFFLFFTFTRVCLFVCKFIHIALF